MIYLTQVVHVYLYRDKLYLLQSNLQIKYIFQKIKILE